ncbi:MAG: hypothetical protein LUD02_10435 [Tannerellaceae bacterium]|nr:hypothetical protein [Tannerellaceae bacterium]
MTDRAFELAWTHSQVVLYHLNIRDAEAQLYQKLAGVLIYMNPSFRAEPTILTSNRKGQNGLWGYGISGDVPLILVRISKNSGIELVRQLVLAHAYWRIKGLTVEILILNEDNSVYRQPLHDEIINLIATGVEAAWLDKSGGIMVRPVEHIPNEDLVLLETTASAIFSDKQGDLAEQLRKIHFSFTPLASLSPVTVARQEVNTVPVPHKTVMNNGYGGFSPDGKEYIITLVPGHNTPAPWSNVIANPIFGTVVSESGGSYTWSENSHEYRLTPWYNDPVKDTSGEALYIRDEESGRYWSPTPLPARGSTSYTIRHGFGYTVFEHTEEDIQSELWVYVAIDAPVKFSVLKLRNLSSFAREISVTGYYEWVLGDTRTRNMLHVSTYVDRNSGVLYARNYYNTDFAGKIPFIDGGWYQAMTGDRKEFIGPGGTLTAPLAMQRKRLSGKVGAGFDPCGAVQIKVELQAGQDKDIPILLGCAASEEDMVNLVNRYRQPGAIRKALVDVQAYWDRILHMVEVETPDTSVNFMANGWLLYQTLSCRIWGRSGYYQSGGAYGFRDQLQDVMALVNAEPAITRHQIVLAAAHQFTKGDVLHWWHPPTGRGVRTRFSDDYLWLPYVTHRYVSAVGDTGILHEVIPFIEGRELNPGEESYYDLPLISNESGTLYEHCVRSIRYGLKFGSHGLPLMGCGDWNDGMNLVGIEGKGESVWLAFFLYDVLMKFSGIATLFGDPNFAAYCLEQAHQLRENIQINAWDGNWYLRAYFDDGTLMGSSTDSECMIDLLPQSWSVISGAGDPERSRLGMEHVEHYLVDRKNKMIKLFTPAFDKFLPSPGYIKGYIPGVRENGGQYTYGVLWSVLAFAMRGEHEKAWELFDLLNPIHHGSTQENIAIYKAEPYVVAADVYSNIQHQGRAGWSWYTGSSAWMYRLLVETLLDVNRVGEQLELSPRMRKEWDQYSVKYRYYGTLYYIISNGIVKMHLRGWSWMVKLLLSPCMLSN